MRLKSDQVLPGSVVAESGTRDMLVKLNESIVQWALCPKVAQFLLKLLSDVHQVVSSVFVGRSIDALYRFHFSRGLRSALLKGFRGLWRPLNLRESW